MAFSTPSRARLRVGSCPGPFLISPGPICLGLAARELPFGGLALGELPVRSTGGPPLALASAPAAAADGLTLDSTQSIRLGPPGSRSFLERAGSHRSVSSPQPVMWYRTCQRSPTHFTAVPSHTAHHCGSASHTNHCSRPSQANHCSRPSLANHCG